MEEKQCDRGIMLYKKKLTPSAKKVREDLLFLLRLPVSSLIHLFLLLRTMFIFNTLWT